MATRARTTELERYWEDVLGGRAALADLDDWTVVDRVQMVRDGVPSRLVTYLAETLGLSRERVYEMIGLARSTGDRKLRSRQPLDPDQGERVLGLARLLGQVERMAEDAGMDGAGTEGFDPGTWLASWLESPVPALGGRRPGDLLDTVEGRALVSRTLMQMQAGSYA